MASSAVVPPAGGGGVRQQWQAPAARPSALHGAAVAPQGGVRGACSLVARTGGGVWQTQG